MELANATIKEIFQDFSSTTAAEDSIFVFYDQDTGTTRGILASDLLTNVSDTSDFVWSATGIYDTGDPVIYNGQWYISDVDGNEGNIPTDGPFWTPENKNTAITVKPWTSGIYPSKYMIVTEGLIMYRLKGSVSVPFNSQTTPSSDTSNWERIGSINASDIIVDDTNLEILASGGPITDAQQAFEEIDSQLVNTASTGVRYGGDLSINTTSSIDVTSGLGRILDNTDPENPVFDNIEWTDKTNFSINTSDLLTWIYFDDNTDTLKTQNSQPSREQRRTKLFLGVVATDGTDIIGTVNDRDWIQQDIQQIRDLATIIGLAKLNGFVVQPNGINLQLDVTSGVLFDYGNGPSVDPHFRSVSVTSPINFFYLLQDGTIFSTGNTVDPDQYDNSGVIASVASNNWTVQQLFAFPNGDFAILYDQSDYPTEEDALDSIISTPRVLPTVVQGGVRIAFLVLQEGATDLTDENDANLINTNKFGELGGGIGGIQDLTGALLAANNLSDVGSATTSRDNLNVYSKTETDTRNQKQSATYALDTGVANAYVIDLSPSVSTLEDGHTFKFKADNANTGASTLNTGSGVKNLVRRDGSNLESGDIPDGSICDVTYDIDNDNYQLLNSIPSGGGGASNIYEKDFTVDPDVDNVIRNYKVTTPIQLSVKLFDGITSLDYYTKLDDGVDTFVSRADLSALNTYLAGLSNDVDVHILIVTDASKLTLVRYTEDRS